MPIGKLLIYPRRSLFVIGLVLLLVAGVIWWQAIWQDPKRTFEDMLASNLSTTSVTKHSIGSSLNQSLDQYARLELGSTNAADWLVDISQANSSITTESIGTPKAGYIRYTHITSGQRRPNGSDYDFRSVVNVWARADQSDDPLSQLFNQTVLDVGTAPLPPIAHLSPSEQQSVLEFIKDQKVFVPSYKDVKSQSINGRLAYTYQVSVRLSPYIRMIQLVARDMSINSLDNVNPNQYTSEPPFVLNVSVDRASHQLVRVNFPTANFMQDYLDWGIVTPINVPHTTISTSELTRRIQALR